MSEGKSNEVQQRATMPSCTPQTQQDPSVVSNQQQNPPAGDRTSTADETGETTSSAAITLRCVESFDDFIKELDNYLEDNNAYVTIRCTDSEEPAKPEMSEGGFKMIDFFFFAHDDGMSKDKLKKSLTHERRSNIKGGKKTYKRIYVTVYKNAMTEIIEKMVRLYFKDLDERDDKSE